MGCDEQTIEVENLSSGFFAIKAKDYFAVSGFNGALTIGEDTDISRRLRRKGCKLIKSNTLLVYNSGHPRTLNKFIKREFWHGDSLRHLLMHKNIDLLTLYFVLNAVAITLLIVLLVYNLSYLLMLSILIMICVVPFLKAVLKVRKINANTFKLFVIYLLYINSRTAALLKYKK
jgi:hypothetical protein